MKSKMLITTLLLALSLLALPCAAEDETEEQPDPPLTGETLIVHEREPSVIRRVPLDEVEEPVTAADGENSPSADADGGGRRAAGQREQRLDGDRRRLLSKFADRPDGYGAGGRIYRFMGRGREKES